MTWYDLVMMFLFCSQGGVRDAAELRQTELRGRTSLGCHVQTGTEDHRWRGLQGMEARVLSFDKCSVPFYRPVPREMANKLNSMAIWTTSKIEDKGQKS